MDIISTVGVVLSSFLANLVVLGIMASLAVLSTGTLLVPIKFDFAKQLLLNGILLMVVMILLSSTQLGMVPTSFESLRDMGLWTIPDGWLSKSVANLITWLLGAASVLGLVLMFMGLVGWFTRSGAGTKLVLIGGGMIFFSLLIGTGTMGFILTRIFTRDIPAIDWFG